MSYSPVSRVLCQTITSPPDQLGWITELSGELQSTDRGKQMCRVNDYAQAAKTNDQTILALQNQKKIAMAKLKTLSYGSPEYNDKLDEINGYTQKILDLGKANAEFKKSAVEIRFKPFDDTIDSLDELIDDCDTLKDMLDSDTFFSDAGELTKQGAANIALINKGLNAEQQKIADYRAQLKNVQQEYNAGNLTKEQLKGYLFSAYGSKIKVVKSNHRYTGTKNKDGSRTGQDWYYEYKVAGQKHNKHVTMYRVMSDCFCENEFGSEDNEIHHIRKKNQYKPSEGKECNRAENLQLLPREIHKNLTYYASKPDAEHNKELEEKIKNADCPSFQLSQEQFQDLLMAALYDCNVSGGKAIMYTTTITDNVEDIEAEAHVLDVGKILKQNLEECE